VNDDLLDEPARADAPAGRIIPTDPDALLFAAEAAYLLGQSVRTLAEWRMSGAGPEFLRLGRVRSVRYRRRDLIAWMDTKRRRSTSDPGPETVVGAG
jgi:hypothetical protein